MLVIVLHHRVEIFIFWSLKPRTGCVVIKRRQLPLLDGDTMAYLSVYRSNDKKSKNLVEDVQLLIGIPTMQMFLSRSLFNVECRSTVGDG